MAVLAASQLSLNSEDQSCNEKLGLYKILVPLKLFQEVFFGSSKTRITPVALTGIDFGVNNLILIYRHSDVHHCFLGGSALGFVNTVFFAGLSLC